MPALHQRLEKSIRSRGLIREGEAVVVAVSGGVDSMVLLHALHELAGRHGWKLMAAHFNHRLRGRASEADERFVRKACEALGVPVVIESGAVRELARTEKISIELAARQLRHRFLHTTARSLGVRTVAAAHHADDQVELFFLRLFRGAGSGGLGGMSWEDPSPNGPEVRLVRPLLDCTKVELSRHAAVEGIQFREDATNAKSDYLRNRIRNELLPMLRGDYQAGIERTVGRAMEVLAVEVDFLRAEALKWMTSRAGGSFAELHPALQRRILQMELEQSGVSGDYALIEGLRLAPEVAVTVSPGRRLRRREDGELEEVVEVQEPDDSADERLIQFAGRSGCAQVGGRKIEWRIEKVSARSSIQAKLRRGGAGEWFDAGRIGAAVVVRAWRPGDRMVPIGMKSEVKLQDLFVNAKIPREERRRRLVGVTEDQRIFWVEGLRVSDLFKLDNSTGNALYWRLVG